LAFGEYLSAVITHPRICQPQYNNVLYNNSLDLNNISHVHNLAKCNLGVLQLPDHENKIERKKEKTKKVLCKTLIPLKRFLQCFHVYLDLMDFS